MSGAVRRALKAVDASATLGGHLRVAVSAGVACEIHLYDEGGRIAGQVRFTRTVNTPPQADRLAADVARCCAVLAAVCAALNGEAGS